ncbi:MAG: M28 family peptidase [Clostridia bacterium]|nr:M28 family peptidase [Clostridia bacterium]
MSFLQEIVKQYPIRKSREQKDAFLRYAMAQARRMGYGARISEDARHRNFVAGDPEKAAVLFTAHYDTPANMLLPNLIIPRNLPLFFAYQLGIVILLFALCAALSFGVFTLTQSGPAALITFLIAYYALLLLMIMGPANRHNVNDNTSGVAAVLRLMESLPEDVREQAAFVLFDDEEKGRQGSKAFAVRRPEVKKGTLVFNMDCVGVGEHLIVIGKNYARALPDYALLQKSLTPEEGIQPHFYPSTGTTMNSDQRAFRRGVGCAFCKRRPVVGYYTPNIHTGRDTVADERNIEYLARHLTDFVKALAEN